MIVTRRFIALGETSTGIRHASLNTR
jgi:hypothetical protein